MGGQTNPNPGGVPEEVITGYPEEGDYKPGAPPKKGLPDFIAKSLVPISEITDKGKNEDEGDSSIISPKAFSLVDLRTGTVTKAEWVPKSDKLLKLEVDFGDLGARTILAGIAQSYTVEAIVGQSVVAVVNLPPRKMMGLESNGMLLAAKSAEGRVILVQCPGVPNGSKLA